MRSSFLAVLFVTLLAACGSNGGTGSGPAVSDAVADAGPSDSSPETAGADATGKPDGGAETADTTAKPDAAPDTAPPLPLAAFVAEQMELAGTPGLSACVFRPGKPMWCQGFGDADIDEERKVDKDTVFSVGALSSTVTAVALLKLVEMGKLGLDDDLDKHLPFSVRNPAHPQVALTARMLLGHTSSLADDAEAFDALYVPGDPTETLAQFASGYFKPGGKNYSPATFLRDEPGSTWEPSLVAMALAGYVVEVVAKQPFDQFCQAQIFTPLGMKASTWKPSTVPAKNIATPYFIDDAGDYAPGEHLNFLGYPASGLYTTAADMAKFTEAIAKGGAPVLKAASVKTMLEPLVDLDEGLEQALGWLRSTFAGKVYIGQDGANDFTGAQAWYRDDKVGVILIGNGSWVFSEETEDDEAIAEIEARLFDEAATLP